MFNFAYAGTGTLPLTATDVAVRWDGLYTFLVWVSIFFFVLVVGGMLYFMITYRHRSGTTSRYITGNHLLEWIWVGLPTLLLLVIFGWGYSVYHEMVQAPYDAYEIRVVAKQWLWTFQYDTGKTMAGEVYVPLNRPVKLVMSSQDVLHSFFIPNFRIKQDVVPGMYSSVWFTATVPGKHQVFCAEYCGTSHSGMMAQIIVLDEVQWERFLNGQKLAEVHQAGTPGKDITLQKVSPGLSLEHYAQAEPTQVLSLIHQGKALYQSVGCATCHSVDGSAKDRAHSPWPLR